MIKQITVSQMATEFGSNKNYIYDLLTLGYIKHIKAGSKYKVKLEWWEEFLSKDIELPSYAEASESARKIRNAKGAA